MTGRSAPHPVDGTIEVHDGPALLSGLADGPGLPAHVRRYGPVPDLRAKDLEALTRSVRLLGRGGAAFPFARKVETVAARRARPVVVVNLSEGEPASLKDAVLAQVAPHLVLDGAAVTARALGARDVHVAVPGEATTVGHALRRALAERADGGRRGRDAGVTWTLHDAAESFVAGQSAAVLELIAGRPNLPVSTWRPSAVSGHQGRPTLLSNAETFAHVGRLALLGPTEYARRGTAEEPGTTLLTLDGDSRAPEGRPTVLEVAYGTPWARVLPAHRLAGPVLLGGYHGSWATPGELLSLTVSPSALREHGMPVGAGVVLPLDHGCPVDRTSRIVSYLASQSARRCGPCVNGLPALHAAVEAVRSGYGGLAEVDRLIGLVEGRGACAHPDGTVRLVRSMITAYGEELAVHARRHCGYGMPLPPLVRMEVSA
jgi:NADH:ubiquinone oxidoreductase subunit F (NADH-binding)